MRHDTRFPLTRALPKVRVGKRAFDITVSFVALTFTAPVLAAVSVLVLAFMGRPVLFRQERPGLHGELFTILKFRTMRAPRDGVSEDDARLTRLGRILRRTSLDELPELVNVLVGDMSLVGPRPLLPEYLDRYDETQRRRHEVRPGLTGWAQVRGRNALTWEEKFELDVFYVDHWSLFFDIEILLRTVAAVLRPTDVTHEGSATMPPFLGTTGKDDH